MEISEANLKRSEFKEVLESRKVRRISGSTVCPMDTMGMAQADYGSTKLSETEFERKAGGESDARHKHEDESTKSFEVHISEIDIIGVKSGVVLDFLKVQVAVQDEIDCTMRYEVVELVKFSDCKQGTCAEGSWIENSKGDIVRYCIDAKQDAKQAAYDHGKEVRQTTIALLIFSLLFSIVISIFCDSDMIQSVTLFHALMGELARTEQGFEWFSCMKHGLEEGESEDMMSSGRQVSSTIIRDGKDYPNVLETDEYADVAGILLYHDLDLTELQFVMGRLRPEVTKSKSEYLYMLKHCLRSLIRRHCCAWGYDFPERHCVVKLADAGWASDGEHRRYADWMHIDHSGDLIELATSIQQLMLLFTAESEFYGIVRGFGYSVPKDSRVWLIGSILGIV